MRKIAVLTIVAAFLLLSLFPVAVIEANEQSSVSVLIDYGDGRYLWLETNETGSAFNITLSACESAGIDVNYSTSSYGVMVNSIGGMAGGWPGPWWHFWLWNSSSESWKLSSKGADSEMLNKGAIAWSLVAGYPGDSPLATPEDMYPWVSYRNGPGAPGYYSHAGIDGPVNRTDIVMNSGFIDSSVIYADGKIIGVTSGIYNWTSYSYEKNPEVFCMDADHHILWRSNIGGAGWQVSSPLYVNGMAVVGSTDGRLYSFDIDTGEEVWNYSTAQSFTGITSSPMYYDGSIYVASGDGFLYSIALNGSLNWKFNTSASVYAATPTTDGYNIFIGNDNGKLYAVNMSGGEVWNRTMTGKVRSAAVVADGMLIVTSSVYSSNVAVSGNITALSTADGSVRWHLETEPVTSSVAYDGQHIFAAAGNKLISIDLDGNTIWQKELGGPIKASPTVAGDTVYAVTSEANSTLFALNSSTGAEIWNDTISGGSYVLSSPVPVEDSLVMGADTGSLYIYTHALESNSSGGSNSELPDSGNSDAGDELPDSGTPDNGTEIPDNGTNAGNIYMALGIAVIVVIALAVLLFALKKEQKRRQE